MRGKYLILILRYIRFQTVIDARSKKRSIIHSPNFRLPLALALVLFFHRRLHRLFARIRASLRTDKAQPFRDRNPRLTKALTSRYAPAVGGSLAGFALGVAPQAQLRLTTAIYMSTRTLEFLYNVMEEKGWLKNKPWWFGSWLLMPVSCAQLFHAFVFDRETTPKVALPLLPCLSSMYVDCWWTVVWKGRYALAQLHTEPSCTASCGDSLAGERRGGRLARYYCQPALAVRENDSHEFLRNSNLRLQALHLADPAPIQP